MRKALHAKDYQGNVKQHAGLESLYTNDIHAGVAAVQHHCRGCKRLRSCLAVQEPYAD